MLHIQSREGHLKNLNLFWNATTMQFWGRKKLALEKAEMARREQVILPRLHRKIMLKEELLFLQFAVGRLSIIFIPSFSSLTCTALSFHYVKEYKTTLFLQKLKLFEISVFILLYLTLSPHVWTRDSLIGPRCGLELNERRLNINRSLAGFELRTSYFDTVLKNMQQQFFSKNLTWRRRIFWYFYI